MKNRTANIIAIAIYLTSSYLSSNILGGLFWNILSVAFLIAGVYGIFCITRGIKFLF